MFNRLLIAIHWVWFVWFLGLSTLIIARVSFPTINIQDLGPFLMAGLVLFLAYMTALRIIKYRWIWFPWKHRRD